MPITEFLERNATLYKDDVSLVEINPEVQEKSRVTWREYSLIEQGANRDGRSEITWDEFNKKANRFANFLLSRGIKKGDKVAILLKSKSFVPFTISKGRFPPLNVFPPVTDAAVLFLESLTGFTFCPYEL